LDISEAGGAVKPVGLIEKIKEIKL